jgi:hypothetical protein
MSHGQSDGMVSWRWGLETAKRLSAELATAGSGEVAFYLDPGLDHELERSPVGAAWHGRGRHRDA